MTVKDCPGFMPKEIRNHRTGDIICLSQTQCNWLDTTGVINNVEMSCRSLFCSHPELFWLNFGVCPQTIPEIMAEIDAENQSEKEYDE